MTLTIRAVTAVSRHPQGIWQDGPLAVLTRFTRVKHDAGMAKTLITTDDLDGSAAAETIRFSYDGTWYSIDLSRKNRTAFEKAIKPYIDVAEKTSGRRSSAATGHRSRPAERRRHSSATDLSVVRAWARENGIAVSDRGRVAQSTLDAYREANR